MGKKFYCIVAVEYGEDNYVREREWYLSEKDKYEEVYEEFIKLQCLSDEKIFQKFPNDVYQVCIELEECIETEYGIETLDIRNQVWFQNPNFRKEK